MIQDNTIILIINEPVRFKSLFFIFQQLGYKVLFAADGRECIRLARRETPELIISETNLRGISAVEFCRRIREDKELWTIPLMFVSKSEQEEKDLIELLEVGADECVADFSKPQYLAAKAKLLIKRRSAENSLIQNYEILRRRQLPIAQLIKDTTKLFVNSESKNIPLENSIDQNFEKDQNQRVDLAMNMIGALANLLEDQVKALEIWKRSHRGGNFMFEQESENNSPGLVCKYFTDDFTNDNLRVN